jgi:hypothetical protein
MKFDIRGVSANLCLCPPFVRVPKTTSPMNRQTRQRSGLVLLGLFSLYLGSRSQRFVLGKIRFGKDSFWVGPAEVLDFAL